MTKFELWIFSFLKKVFKYFSGITFLDIWDESDLINKLESMSELKVKSDDKDFYLRQKLDAKLSFVLCFFGGGLILLFSKIHFSSTAGFLSTIFISLIIFLFTFIVVGSYHFLFRFVLFIFQSLFDKLFRKSTYVRKFSLLPHLSILPIFLSIFTLEIFGIDFAYFSNNVLFSFLFIILMLIISLVFIYLSIVTIPPYVLEEVNVLPAMILSTLSIVAFIVDEDPIPNNKIISLSLFSITLLCTLCDFLTKYFIDKYQSEAQRIFEEQLIKQKSQVSYEELKKCYYFGGRKYREKILSTEKFIKIVNKREPA